MNKLQLLFLLLWPLLSIANKKSYFTKKTNQEIVIDGNLNEDVWKSANWGADFYMHYPYDNKAPTYQTKFAIVYDANFVYVAIKAFDSDPDKIVQRLTRRDDIDGDYLSINIDSYHDHQTSYEFRLSAAGTKRDKYVSSDGDSHDESWNAIWWGKSAITADGWQVEMKIPFSQFRFVNKSVQTWGIQVRRYVQRLDEVSLWIPIKRDAPGWVHHFGLLEGIVDIKPKKVFDLIPYLVGSVETYEKDDEDPFLDGFDMNGNAGLDGKIGLTNNLTLDFTINPDFGQVEADPSSVNLSGFELFFGEQRPFFIEGSSILDYPVMFNNGDHGVENLFYSRRVGRNPHYYPDLADEENYKEFAKQPKFTRIIGAAKVTGRTNKGLSIGILESITAKEYAEIEDTDGNTRRELVEPLTNYSVVSLKQDINKGNTIVGGMLTSTNRIIDEPQLEELRTNAYSGGVTFTQHWKKKTWYVSGKFHFSHVEGSEEAIRSTQESSVHLYQRPGASHINFDTTQTTLSGTGGSFFFGKSGGGPFRFNTSLFFKSPGLELNDAGFVRHTDEIIQVFWAGYDINEPFSIFKEMELNGDQWSLTDFAGNYITMGTSFNFETEFRNKYRFEMGINGQAEERSTSFLRGGPTYYLPPQYGGWLWFGTDRRKKLMAYGSVSRSSGLNNWFESVNYRTGVTYKPWNFINFRLDMGYNKRQNEQQYVSDPDFANDKRYVLGTLQQETYNMSLRINCNITPDISIQYWGQPFISNGLYSDLKQVTDAANSNYENRFSLFNTNNQLSFSQTTDEYFVDEDRDGTTDYSFENPDFNTKVFLSNMVFRWEYMPGSTLFFVWSQNRENYDIEQARSLGANVKNTFNFQAHNTFLVKFSYRIGL